ncbi:MAG TPA: serine/threonine-protein kinase [Thermoanaerobaculia bacterium]|jgi:serine/threonine-protein kinase
MHERIGKYHVIRAAGHGGFGTVYEGYDVELDRNVAIKICVGDDRQIERFRREARIVSQLKHRNVALVFDFGFDEQAGVHYLVEEFLSGVDLEKKLDDRDRLPPALRLRYLIGIVQGLEFVHEKGLIHRDLSPRNVRVLHDHTIKIMDFGLAKDVTDSTLTLIGDNFGTIGYTAPEQVTGMRAVDHRTDVFSFGVIAYELLTLTNPFLAEDMGTFIRKLHRHQPRPLTELWPHCPPDLAAAVHKCMEKDPEERPASCSELLPILKAALRTLRDEEVPAIFAPPLVASEPYQDVLLDEEISVDSGRPTSHLLVPRTLPAPAAPSTRGAAAPASRGALPGYLMGVAATAALAVLVFAVLRPGDAGEATAAAVPGRESARPSVAPGGAAAPAGAALGFPLRCESSGPRERASILLLAPLPPDVAGISHCYVVRKPAWSYGAKVRRECGGETLRHLDRVEVRSGQGYAYQVQVADAAGALLAESSCSLVVPAD